jgi:YHS domain-containing protein
MKRLALALLFAVTLFWQPPATTGQPRRLAPRAAPTAAPDLAESLPEGLACPVTGEPADSRFAAAYKGARVYFASQEARREFQEQPRAFASLANAQLAVSGQAEQTKCPLEGRPVARSLFLNVAGVDVAFCCEECQKKAALAPADEAHDLIFAEAPFKKAFAVKQAARNGREQAGRRSGKKEGAERAAAHGDSLSAGAQRLLEHAVSVQEKYQAQLLRKEGMVGVGAALDDNGKALVRVFVEDEAALAGLPRQLDDVPVLAEAVGRVYAGGFEPAPAAVAAWLGSAAVSANPRARFDRPVPLGVSTGLEQSSCNAGTIGCRLKGTKNGVSALFALSNNHVFADSNLAPLNADILQPGRADSNCNRPPSNRFATLERYQVIQFGGLENKIDAAIANVTAATMDSKTPDDGYGRPKSAVVDPFPRQAVQKYGRTTGLTKGTVIGVNLSMYVYYGQARRAYFTRQIVITSVDGSSFSKGGDSGSLIVSDPGRNPVGLLFAGTANGRYTIANRISEVLAAFSSYTASIDGE